MNYESSILKRLIEVYGVVGNPRYISEIIKQFIVQGKECYPGLFTYQADWLAHIDEFGLTPEYTVSYTGQHIYAPNTKEKPIKSAILKGSTKYRDIDTGEVLDVFEDGRNLELVSVKMPVLTTSNEDGTKTNILSCNEEVELCAVGDVKDELNLLTGEMTKRYGIAIMDGSDDENYFDNYNEISFVIYGEVNNPIFSNMKKNSYNILCDKYYVAKDKDDGWRIHNDSTATGIYWFNNNLWIRIPLENLGGSHTKQAFKTWLQSNPITIQYELATPVIKTVDLTIRDKDHQKVERLTSFEGGTHFTTSSQDGSLLPTLTVDVATDLEETLMVCSLEGNTI